jgi:signal transduction histidine kinase
MLAAVFRTLNPLRRLRSSARWAAWLVLCALLVGTVCAATQTQHRALAVASDAAEFPSGRAGVEVTLPDDWRGDWPGNGGAAWYRIALDWPEGARAEPAAVLVARACGALEARINGQPVSAQDGHRTQGARGCYEPQLLVLAPGLLAPGVNMLDLRLNGQPRSRVASSLRAGGLSAPIVGPQSEVAPLYRQQLLVRTVLPQALAAVLGVIGALALVVWAGQRRQRFWPYFGGTCLAWAIAMVGWWWSSAPLNAVWAERLIATTAAVATLCSVQFLLRYALWRHRAVDIALSAQCLLVPASMALAGPPHTFAVASAWYALLAVEFAAALAWFLWLTWRFSRREFALASMTAGAAAGLLAMQVVLQQLGPDGPGGPAWALGPPLLLVFVAACLLYKLGTSLNAADGMHGILEARAREAAAEMERSFAQMAEMRVEQVTQQERKRIAADLHDDLGAKLLTIVHTSESDRISSLARDALEEMRLSVRGLTGKPVYLADALGDWRAEVMARLAQAGVEAEWKAPVDEMTQTLPARTYVQTTRILREAVSNVIKHSGASHCKIRCRLVERDFQLVVQDNGQGISMELDGKLDRGHGMASMKHRAKQMHGQCLVESGPGYGTVIRLTLPL